MEWSQILCSLVGFTKTNTGLFLLRHITTLTSIQARIIFLKIFLVIIIVVIKKINAIGPLVAEILMFESVNTLMQGRTDTHMTARWIYYMLTL